MTFARESLSARVSVARLSCPEGMRGSSVIKGISLRSAGNDPDQASDSASQSFHSGCRGRQCLVRRMNAQVDWYAACRIDWLSR